MRSRRRTPTTKPTGHQIELDEGVNDIEIVVTAEDGTTETYKVTLTRTVRSTDSSLSDLTLKDGEDDELNQTFSSGLITYTSNVDDTVANLSLTATASDSTSGIVVTVSGAHAFGG